MPQPISRSRFAGLNTRVAALLLVLLLALIIYGIARPAAAPAPTAARDSDAALYHAIVDRMSAGQGYYSAAAEEQRARGYPLKPFVTMRPPLLAWTIASVGVPPALILFRLLMAAALVTTVIRLRCEMTSRPVWLGASLVAALSIAGLAAPSLLFWHEAWAALLLALALAVRTRRLWWPAVLAALAAALFRELAAPLLAVMAWHAWRDGQRKECASWLLAIVVFALALGWHALQVGAQVRPGDLRSPGWAQAGGWGFILMMTQKTSLFALLPPAGAAVLTPLALLGWSGFRSRYAARVVTLLGGYALLFLLIGRPTNFYWGLLLAPLLPAGLVFAPIALADLAKAALARHRRAQGA